MWKECRLWIIDSLVSITLFLLVPILLSLTGLVTISVAPGAALIVLGYALYIFQCVFSRDMKRGIWALVDLMRNISVTVKQQPLIEHNSYRIKYYPFSKIIVDIAPKS